MPFIGLQPFLLKIKLEHYHQKVCVNALHRASAISTTTIIVEEVICMKSVNALHRASAISTIEFMKETFGKRRVLMPFIGLQPFLRDEKS